MAGGVLSEGEGVLSEGEGVLSEGEGVLSEGEGVLSEGEGVLSEGKGALNEGEGVLSEGRRERGREREGEGEGAALLVESFEEHSITVGSSSAVSPPTQRSPAILRYLQEIRTLCHNSSACGVWCTGIRR